MENMKIVLFKNKEIRKTIYNSEWWFVINDVIESSIDSTDPAQYFKKLKERDDELKKLTEKGGVQLVPPLMHEVETTGGKQKMYCWHTEGLFRLVQSIIDGHEHLITDGVAVVVPAGAKHNVMNTSETEDLKLYTLYSPPHHQDGIVRPTKADAMAREAEFDGKTTE